MEFAYIRHSYRFYRRFDEYRASRLTKMFCPLIKFSPSHFTILKKKFLQSHLFIIRVFPQNNINILRYFNNFLLIPFTWIPFIYPCPLTPPPQLLYNQRWILSLVLKQQYRFLIVTFSINTSVFFSSTQKRALLNMHLFLKGKFNHMRW